MSTNNSYLDFLALAESSAAVVIKRDDSATEKPIGVVTQGGFSCKLRASSEFVKVAAGYTIINDGKESKIFAPGDGQQKLVAESADNPLAFEQSVVNALQLDVLGEHEGQDSIDVFSSFHRKLVTIKDINRLSYASLLKICGPPAKAAVRDAGEESYDKFTVSQVKDSISLLAGFQRLGSESLVGVGCWQGRDQKGAATNAIVVVGAGEAALLNGSLKLHKFNAPRVGGRLVDISGSEPWYDHENLSESVLSCDHAAAKAAIAESIGLFSRWRWKHQSTTPEVLTGLIIATWIQSLWVWRPQVATPGPSNAGKTVLFNALVEIFGKLAVKSSDSSAAGIRQEIQSSSKVILCDEFEDSHRRRETLEMLRASGRGDKILRGTPGQKGHKYGLRHIAWVASIETGLKREADRNRFIMLELMRPEKSKEGKLQVPPAEELARLGQRLLAIALRYGLEAVQLAAKLNSRDVANRTGVNARIIESHAVPAAMLATALGMSEPQAIELLLRIAEPLRGESQSEPDEADLLESILFSVVDLGKGVKSTVGQLLDHEYIDSDNKAALERCGIGIVFGRETSSTARHAAEKPAEQYLFLAHKQILEHLMKGSRRDGQAIEQILRRIDGAFADRRYIAGHRPWGTSIPMSFIREHFTGEENKFSGGEKNLAEENNF